MENNGEMKNTKEHVIAITIVCFFIILLWARQDRIRKENTIPMHNQNQAQKEANDVNDPNKFQIQGP